MTQMRKLMEAMNLNEAGGNGGRWDLDEGDELHFSEPIPFTSEAFHISSATLNVYCSDSNRATAGLLLMCDDDDMSETFANRLAPHIKKPDFLSRFIGDRAKFFKATDVEGGLVAEWHGAIILIYMTCINYKEYIIEYAN